MADAPVKTGEILAGKYHVDRVLGQGGMGVVVAATHIELREPRALKFMLPEALGDAEAVARFLREARACSRLKGEHIARVYDVGRLENGAPYMVMEYLEGNDLSRLLKRHGPLSPSDVALYLLHVCEALAEAHASGIIHRDLKPGNLFLTQGPDGTACVKVLDFGISKILDEAGIEHAMTRSHTVLGSPFYMSPEQMRSTRDVDTRTDIWALGVIGYQLLTGRLPFHGRTVAEIIAAVIQVEPPLLSHVAPSVPAGLAEAIARCLQKDLALRWARVADLAEAIAPFAPAGGAHSAEISKRVLGVPSVRSHSLSTTAVAAMTQPETGSNLSGPVARGGGRTIFVGVAAVAVVGLALAAGLAIGVSRSSGALGTPAALTTKETPALPASIELPAVASSALLVPAAAPVASAPASPSSSAPAALPTYRPAAKRAAPGKAPADPFGAERK